MVELVDTRDLKSRGPGRVRAGSSPAPGTTIFLIDAARRAGLEQFYDNGFVKELDNSGFISALFEER